MNTCIICKQIPCELNFARLSDISEKLLENRPDALICVHCFSSYTDDSDLNTILCGEITTKRLRMYVHNPEKYAKIKHKMVLWEDMFKGKLSVKAK